jgi:flagellar biosynthesis/type III secretory pathway chaperone
MKSLIGNLIDVLQQSEDLYRQLEALLRQETRAVVSGQIERLVALTSEKQGILAQLSLLSHQQGQLRYQLAGIYRMPNQGMSLSLLAERVPEPYSQQLKQRRDSMRECLNGVRRLNQESRVLVQHCLKMVQNALSFFAGWASATPVYGSSGEMNTRSRGGRLLSSNV